jgi:hypothetical protein
MATEGWEVALAFAASRQAIIEKSTIQNFFSSNSSTVLTIEMMLASSMRNAASVEMRDHKERTKASEAAKPVLADGQREEETLVLLPAVRQKQPMSSKRQCSPTSLLVLAQCSVQFLVLITQTLALDPEPHQ